MQDQEKTKILNCLTEKPRNAGELSRLLGIPREELFSSLRTMEQQQLIAWDGHEWTIASLSDDDEPTS